MVRELARARESFTSPKHSKDLLGDGGESTVVGSWS